MFTTTLLRLLQLFCFLRLPQRQSFFSSWIHWTQYSAKLRRILNVTSDHSCRKMFRFLVWKWFSPSYAWLDITTCIKNRVSNNSNLRCFMFSIIERLYKSFSVINSSVQIFAKLNQKFFNHSQMQPPKVFHKKAVP